MSSSQSLQNELNGVESENDSSATKVKELEKQLVERDEEIANLKREFKDLDDSFLERLEKGVEETNFDYGNKLIEMETKNMKLEIIAKKYEELKKEVADEKDQALASKPGNKDQETLVFVLQKLVHQLEASNQSLRNVIDSCYEAICSETLKTAKVVEVQRKQDRDLEEQRETIKSYEFNATVLKGLIEDLSKEKDELMTKNEDLEFCAALRDEEERMEQELTVSDQETDQAANSSSRKRSICKNVEDEAKKPLE
ncbi:hypothetical protein L5515_015443 [Caenorhabditis briggsae]|uniref:Uncharacterized protein n=1 Tax=Caenorhabditis briggsae TaxID=6238 RepID=A0AAE9J9B2_CAEBR|nr:hypothetical protein L5515_015443 [Caenorhabditis briggsae]